MVTCGFSIVLSVVLFVLPAKVTPQDCYENRELFSTNIAKAGYASCPLGNDQMYIQGFGRKTSADDNLKDLTMAKCCQPSKLHLGKPFTIQSADWEMSFKKAGWATCQSGYFLNGFYREEGADQLGNIRWATCAKPAFHPYWYKECYDQDVDQGNLWQCSRNTFYVVGLHRGASDALSSINKIRCCNMYDEVLPVSSLKRVKTRTMDMTMNNLGILANYLGYGWAGGCRTQYAGQDFRREGDTWKSNYQEPCNGHMKKDRLKITYENFSFKVKKMDYLKPEVKSLKPIVQDIGQIKNEDTLPTKTKVTREIKSVRTVVHSSESRFKSAFGASVTLSYKSPPLAGVLTGTFSASITLSGGDEAATINRDENGEIKWDIVRVKEQQTTNPKSGSTYQITTSRSQVDVPYRATILVQFTAKLDGFMRWGGDNQENANFHEKHRGSDDRSKVSYQIGSKTVPFYKFLKTASQRGDSPWLWHDMKQKYQDAAKVIDDLADESLYEFVLEGKFKDVYGLDFRVKWSDIPVGRSNVTVYE